MLSAVLQSEIDTLQSQIAQLQAQIAAAQARVKELGEAESIADGAIQSLQTALQKVSALAPGAIATLRQTVMNLFNNGNDASDDGNQPIAPAPQPAPGGESVDLPLEPELDSEDVSPVALQDLEEAEDLAYVDLVRLSNSVAYMRRLDGEVIAVYAGGNSKGKLRNWGDWLTRTHSVTSGYELREGKRLDTKWELKLTAMTLKQIERLATCDFSKDPRSCYPEAPKRPAQPAPRIVEVGDIGVGDRVRSVTVRHWEYTVTGINSDGFFECDRLNVTPVITQVLHPGPVER